MGTPLKDWDIQINYGIKTGCNEAFIINKDKKKEILSNCQTKEEEARTDEIIRPVLRGRDIKRYGYIDSGWYLINTHNGIKGKIPPINIDDYPAIKAHLDQYWDKISIRSDKGETPYNLRNCAYLEDFSKPKIIYQELSQGSCFAYDKEGKYMVSNSAYLITGEHLEYLIRLLNSRVVESVYKYFYATILGITGVRWLAQNIVNLPIPKFEDKELQHQILRQEDSENIEALVGSIYKLNMDEMSYLETMNDKEK